jgi:hypothetical protein
MTRPGGTRVECRRELDICPHNSLLGGDYCFGVEFRTHAIVASPESQDVASIAWLARRRCFEWQLLRHPIPFKTGYTESHYPARVDLVKPQTGSG